MGRSYLSGVLVWSIILCVFAIVYAAPSLRFGKPPAAMLAYQGYLIVGLLGVFVGNVLKDQQRRISELEQKLSKQS